MDPERRRALEVRARVLDAVRAFFRARDFLEVETPLLVRAPALEVHLDAIAAADGWLITSPEFQMKRLLAEGFSRIFTICKCFRDHEHGAQHAREFTMLEWYRGDAALDRGSAPLRVAARPGEAGPFEAIRDDTEQLVSAVAIAVHGHPLFTLRGREIDVRPPWPRMTVRDAMNRWAGVAVDGDEPAAELTAKVRAAGIAIADDLAWDDAFFTAFVERVDPGIAGLDRPLILEDWPAPLAALARRRPDDPRTALRFEAYIAGLELANAFDELVDPVEQRARFEVDQRTRAARGKPVHPIDERLVEALAHVPPSAGIALGIDRLAMLAAGVDTIDRVLTFTTGEL
ncbi:MAG: EF-P lysine aminoacylase GenX [Acidobacteriota bacterium]